MKPSHSLGGALLSLLLSTTLLHIPTVTSATACHKDDQEGLLAFKSGITHDPLGMLGSWNPTTHCCAWPFVHCSDGVRVDVLRLYDDPDTSYSMTGTISSSLAKLQYLTTIDFSNLRYLSGPFPEFVFRLPRLKDVRMSGNQFSGPLPKDIGNLTRIEVFGFSRNRFVGSIPSSISKMTSLSNLDLSGNLLNGPIPDGIKMLKNLDRLDLSGNRLSGNIPDFSFTQLSDINLSNNKLSGNIPASLASLAKTMVYFLAGHNDLTGEIPSFLGKFQQLLSLDLSWNRFSGSVPKTFEDMTALVYLDLSHNNLVDPLPTLNKEDRLSYINLSYNQLQLGVIPQWVISGYWINHVGLVKCGIKASLDDWKSEYTYFLYTVDISENEMSGSSMKFFNSTPQLREFRASGNKLRFDMGRLEVPRLMKTMDLSRNLVFGKLPASVGRIEKLDVSYNHLCGPIPATNNSASSFTGNDCLCGSPLPPCTH